MTDLPIKIRDYNAVIADKDLELAYRSWADQHTTHKTVYWPLKFPLGKEDKTMQKVIRKAKEKGLSVHFWSAAKGENGQVWCMMSFPNESEIKRFGRMLDTMKPPKPDDCEAVCA